MPEAISTFRHPDYSSNIVDWTKFRLTVKGGRDFVTEYLEKFSIRETDNDFNKRRKITYCPAHAKAALYEIKNAIAARMIDVKRSGGPASYTQASLGENGGVDRHSRTMNGFIETEIIVDLLALGKVGVFIDKLPLRDTNLLSDNNGITPYLYTYKCEDIMAWSFNSFDQIDTILLREQAEIEDPDTGLIIRTEKRYRYLAATSEGVVVRFYDKNSVEIVEERTVLDIGNIPFVVFEISQSLLEDVADYQVSLLNLESSDIGYSLKSNFPFYTEQFDPYRAMVDNLPPHPTDTVNEEGEAAQKKGKDPEVAIGSSKGRQYPKGLERPGFIHPSSEPLRASMEKEEKIKQDIKLLINLAVTNLELRRVSAESKEFDNRNLESGLASIGLELEHGERQIAQIWNQFEGESEQVTIQYPRNYSLRSEEERQREADKNIEQIPKIPSKVFQKELAKEAVTIMIGHKVTNDTLIAAHKEIDAAEVVAINPETIIADHEAGFVSTQTASTARLYPEGEVEQAKKDHAERAVRILNAQMSARGAEDLTAGGNADDEKEASQDPDLEGGTESG